MTIGFFETEMEALVTFKSCIDQFPSHDWCLYIHVPEPSWGEQKKLDMHDTTSGLAWILGKDIDAVFLGAGVSKETVETLLTQLTKKDVTLFTSREEFTAHLTAMPESEPVPGKAKLRDIHLTKHSEEQDAFMAETLGGFLIND